MKTSIARHSPKERPGSAAIEPKLNMLNMRLVYSNDLDCILNSREASRVLLCWCEAGGLQR